MSISLNPDTLPPLDIVGLAQSGAILRAERKTPPDGVPAFVTRAGWEELIVLYGKGSTSSYQTILPALEHTTNRIMAHAAEAAAKAGKSNAVFSMNSDLFTSDPTLVLAFVRDSQHPVACALIGTSAQLADILRQPGQFLAD